MSAGQLALTAQSEDGGSAALSRPGFRLARLELYNWGTFHDRVWSVDARGENVLLTGDIGSGKSTVVDALTTLLVAPQKVAYNKAAGADVRERNLRSYVAGHYKSERGDAGLSARPVALRDRNAYSVLLGRFVSVDLGLCVTLAQVFCLREAQGQPERLYAIAERPAARHRGALQRLRRGDPRAAPRRLRAHTARRAARRASRATGPRTDDAWASPTSR